VTAAARAPGARFPGPHLPPGLRRWVRPLLLAAVAVATITALAVYVFPTRTWLDQRAALAETRLELRELEAERSALEQRVVELDADDQIEEIARSEYGLVRPGEEAYAVLPAPEKPVELPSLWPFGELLAPTAAEPADPAAAGGPRD
jgi:cell division protein FtsB